MKNLCRPLDSLRLKTADYIAMTESAERVVLIRAAAVALGTALPDPVTHLLLHLFVFLLLIIVEEGFDFLVALGHNRFHLPALLAPAT